MLPAEGGIAFDAVFAFNESHAPSRIMLLSLEDARVFVRCLVDGVYQARTQNAITETMHIGIMVHPNGLHLQIGNVASPVELFIGIRTIWQVMRTVLCASSIAYLRSRQTDEPGKSAMNSQTQ